MNDKQQAELAFWKRLYADHGSDPERYVAFRAAEYIAKTKRFIGFERQRGLGLDVGCGLVSIFERSPKQVWAIDPLMCEYRKILDLPHDNVLYVNPGAELPTFDWVFCVNVLDHTAQPATLLSSIHYILRPRGMFYFEVNFDDTLDATAHYSLWNEALVTTHFNPNYWRFSYSYLERIVEHHQWRYWGMWERI